MMGAKKLERWLIQLKNKFILGNGVKNNALLGNESNYVVYVLIAT